MSKKKPSLAISLYNCLCFGLAFGLVVHNIAIGVGL